MVFANGSNDAYSQMVQLEPGIWAIPGVAFHYARANQRYFERTGKRFRSTEGFRRKGNPGDWDDTPNTQYFYYERKQAIPSSPSAAYPGLSIHGYGRAFDIDLGQDGLEYDVMRECLEAEGFKFDIEGERWHCNYYEDDMWTAYDMSGLNTTTLEDDMYDDTDREFARLTNAGVVDSVKRLYSIGQEVNQIHVIVAQIAWAVGDKDRGLRTLVAQLSGKVDDVTTDLDDIAAKITAAAPVAPDLKAIQAPTA